MRSHGADIVLLDKPARKRGLRVFDRYWNAYLVVADDGRIITTGIRRRRVKRT